MSKLRVDEIESIGTGAVVPVSRIVVAVDSIADLLALPEGQRKEGLRYLVKGYHAGSGVGGGGFYWDAACTAYADEAVHFGSGTGRFVRDLSGPITPEHGGALGEDSVNDTAGIFRCVSYINERGGNVEFSFPSGPYYMGTVYTSSLPSDDGGWRDHLLERPECQIAFVNVTNLKITGPGSVRVPDEGTPTYPHNLMTYSIFAFQNCHNVLVDSIGVDGNRLGQTHTIGTNTGHNYGIGVREDCSNIRIQNCDIRNLGSLRDGTDKRGDALIVLNGATDIFFVNNTVRNVGRWCCVLESGPGGTRNYVIEGNTYFGANRAVPPSDPNDYEQNCLGFVDIESFTDHSDIFIRNNVIYRSGVISCAGFNSSSPEVVVDGFFVENNVWHCEEIGGSDGYERIVAIAGSSTTRRIVKRFNFNNNKVFYGSEELSVNSDNRILSLEIAVFFDPSIRDNLVVQHHSGSDGRDGAGMYFLQCSLQGLVRVSGNIVNYGPAARLGWFGIRGGNTTGIPTRCMFIFEGNVLERGDRGLYFAPDANDEGTVLLINNRVNAALGKTSDIQTSNYPNWEIYNYDLPLTLDYAAKTTELRSDVDIGDTLTTAFRIVPTDSSRSRVAISALYLTNNNTGYSGRIELEATRDSGIWTIDKNITEMQSNAQLSISTDGDVIVIQSSKGGGGSPRRPTLAGTVLLSGARLELS